jgi:hypothetical protein
VIEPSTVARNFTPNSTAAASEAAVTAGVVVSLHILHGQLGAAAVVNDERLSAAIALPAASFTPPLPPLTTRVYVVEEASVSVGFSVAVRVAAS